MPLARRPRPSPPPAPFRLFRLFFFVFLPPPASFDAALDSAIIAATPLAALLAFGAAAAFAGGAGVAAGASPSVRSAPSPVPAFTLARTEALKSFATSAPV